MQTVLQLGKRFRTAEQSGKKNRGHDGTCVMAAAGVMRAVGTWTNPGV